MSEIKEKVLSVSSIATYQTCPTQYYIKYGLGIDTPLRYAAAAQRGTAVHKGLEAWLTGVSVAGAIGSLDDIPIDIRSEALRIVEFYTPQLPEFTPVIYDGKPMVEHQFTVDFPKYETTLQGTIDAVVTDAHGNYCVIDWKARKDGNSFYDRHHLNLDRQLLIYAAILKHKLDIPVTRVIQVQLSCTLPAMPKLKKGGQAENMGDWYERMNKTTFNYLTTLNYSKDVLGVLLEKYQTQLVPDDHFLELSEIDISHADKALFLTLQSVKRIKSDEDFLPILDAYRCKMCPVSKICTNLHFPA